MIETQVRGNHYYMQEVSSEMESGSNLKNDVLQYFFLRQGRHDPPKPPKTGPKLGWIFFYFLLWTCVLSLCAGLGFWLAGIPRIF